MLAPDPRVYLLHIRDCCERLRECAGLQETGAAATPSDEERERRRQAVASMVAFREEHHLTLGPGERIQDLIHEGHKY